MYGYITFNIHTNIDIISMDLRTKLCVKRYNTICSHFSPEGMGQKEGGREGTSGVVISVA